MGTTVSGRPPHVATAADTPGDLPVQTTVGSVQDYKGTTVSAVVTLDGRGDAPVAQREDHRRDGRGGPGRDLHHRVGGGADGAYPPTKLEPDGTWSEGGDTGAFTYSYPITLPSARGSLTPSVTLAYDSQSVDGTTATTVRTCLGDAGGLGMGLATDVAVGSEIGSFAGPAGIVVGAAVGIAIGLAASSRVENWVSSWF